MANSEIEREAMEYDVVIVGAGPSGLAAAIKLKQLNPEINIAILEKASEVGAHILSGAVIDPSGLDELLPDWRNAKDCPLSTQVTKDEFYLLGEGGGIKLPNFAMPPLMNNHGNYIGSLGNVCRYLGQIAEDLGVEIYPGFAASALVYDENGALKGVQVGDMGIGRDGNPKSDFTPGIELHGKYTIFAEGARGSLSKQLIEKYNLDAGRDVQKFGIGIKELWQIDPAKFQSGLVRHSFGWPLSDKDGNGGAFLYHWGDNFVSVGFVVHLNYKNPYLSPFEEFQKFKTHPMFKDTFEGGKRIAYGARALTEGGAQSVPQLAFPGGVLVGCGAGFMNVPRIKGSHNAIKSGILAAIAINDGLANDAPSVLNAYDQAYEASAIKKELNIVRNVKPLWGKFGTAIGVALGGLDMWTNSLFGFSVFGTMKHGKADFEYLKPAAECEKITYPKPDGKITFDRLSSVFLSNTNHEEDQPIHLQLLNPDLQKSSELEIFDGPSTRYCPAGVYEWIEENGAKKYVINAQNCVHCKTCDIKDPNQNINWTTPQGAEGPIYSNM
jgi:electron-transferring-flavoprotein dehydrogenase